MIELDWAKFEILNKKLGESQKGTGYEEKQTSETEGAGGAV